MSPPLIRSGEKSRQSGEFTLREITPGDSRLIYEWRMDPLSRPMFKTQDLVPFETHEKFFARYFDPANSDQWFILENGANPVASEALYDFSPSGDECEWGRILVPPQLRGRGYGRKVCEMTLAHARTLPLRRIRSEVLAENDSSMHVHHALGFQDVDDYIHEGRRFVRLVLELK